MNSTLIASMIFLVVGVIIAFASFVTTTTDSVPTINCPSLTCNNFTIPQCPNCSVSCSNLTYSAPNISYNLSCPSCPVPIINLNLTNAWKSVNLNLNFSYDNFTASMTFLGSGQYAISNGNTTFTVAIP